MFKAIIFSHPDFLESQSMPRYTNYLANNLLKKGINVQIWSPKARFYKIFNFNNNYRKYLGYVDQFLIFPLEVKFRLFFSSKTTLFVLADQALAPWVSLIKKRKHVIHCHDFIALNSALGKIPENKLSWSGKLYQKYIQNGFSKGLNFISISNKTNYDLIQLHNGKILFSSVCYNGLNRKFQPLNSRFSRNILSKKLNINLENGYILHIGGNQFYKNRKGCIKIYNSWRSNTDECLKMLLIGEKPSNDLLNSYNLSPYINDIHFIVGLEDDLINLAYSGALCLLFPSLDEGFGWPIAEAMASGCLVISTDLPPMNEVTGNANKFSIKRMPFNINQHDHWAKEASLKISEIINLDEQSRNYYLNQGFENIKRFDSDNCFDKIFQFYIKIYTN